MTSDRERMAGLRCVVVDDEAFMRGLLARILRGLGAGSVQPCEDGRAALDGPAPEAELILCDLNMPGMDGVEFLRHLAQTGFTGAIILLSGEDERVLRAAEALAQAHRLRVLGALAKPVTPAMLAPLLQQALEPPAETAPRPRPAGMEQPPPDAAALAAGIAAGELELWYQPKVSLTDRSLLGAEGLVRWRRPQQGLVPPGLFIPLAEEAGLIGQVTERVLRLALRQGAAWRAAGLDLKLAANVSIDCLTRLDLPDAIAAVAAAEGMPLSRLVLEVTESRLMRDIRAPLETLSRLRLKGVQLSIDDFGTGHSSLEQLKRIPFTEMKIDRAFVHGAARDATARSILQASLRLGRDLGMQVVAEGVETQEDWALAAGLGIDMVQGYFIARPMPAAEFWDWARSHARLPNPAPPPGMTPQDLPSPAG